MTDKTLYDYWMVCYRHKMTILVMVATAVVSAILISASLPSIYEARAMFYVPASATTQRANTGSNDVPLPTSNQDDAKANIGILKGRDALRSIQAQFPQKSIDALQRNVDFTAGRDGIIHVYVRDQDPTLAATIANAYFSHFNRFLLEQMQQRAGGRSESIKQRLHEVNRQLAEVISQRNELASATGSPSLDAEGMELVRERRDMNKELDELQDQIGRRAPTDGRSEAPSLVATPVVDDLERQIAQLNIELAKARARTLPNHPDQIGLLQSLEAAKAALEKKRAASLEERRARASTVASMLAKREKRMKSIPQYQSRLKELDQSYRDLRDAQTFLKNSLEEATLAGIKAGQVGIMIETAYPPEIPVFPIYWLNILIAVLASLLTGMLYALLLDYIEERAIAQRARNGTLRAP